MRAKTREKILWVLLGCSLILGITGNFRVKGDPGRDGLNGRDGQDASCIIGKDGEDGRDGRDGKDGSTPYIGENGNWFIDGVDTGVNAEGRDGIDGKDGVDGQLIVNLDNSWTYYDEVFKLYSNSTGWVYAGRLNPSTGLPEFLLYDYAKIYDSYGSSREQKVPITTYAYFNGMNFSGCDWATNSGDRPSYYCKNNKQTLLSEVVNKINADGKDTYWFDYGSYAKNPYFDLENIEKIVTVDLIL